MKRGFLSLPIFVWVLFVQFLSCAKHSGYFTIDSDVSPDKLPYEWETIEEWRSGELGLFAYHLFDDLDGDGSSERIYWYNDISSPARIMSALVYYEDPVKGKVRWQDNSNTGCEIKNISFFDLNRDGRKEIFVSKVAGDSIFFRITDLEMNLIREFLVDVGKGLDPRGGWILNIWTLGVCDLNGDGYSDLIYTLDAKPDQPGLPNQIRTAQGCGGQSLGLQRVGTKGENLGRRISSCRAQNRSLGWDRRQRRQGSIRNLLLPDTGRRIHRYQEDDPNEIARNTKPIPSKRSPSIPEIGELLFLEQR